MRLPRHKACSQHDPARLLQAADAVRNSEQVLAQTRGMTSEIQELTTQLRRLRAQNNFAERIATMLREAGVGHERP